ncbi:hypothetical protein K502DRAFT_344021 [Neoconidiobolus thromboides FSU 785]|nr:hypothetical protein K502DRAFT_344021 [Neoconidiobolus thromboides FSU 785]
MPKIRGASSMPKKPATARKSKVNKSIVEPKDLDNVPDIDFEEILQWVGRYQEALEYKQENMFEQQVQPVLNSIEKLVQKNGIIKIDGPPKLTSLEKYLFGGGEDKIDFKNDIKMDHLTTIMGWKLSRGKYRMRLASLVKENKEEEVTKIMNEVYEKLIKIDSETFFNHKDTVFESIQKISEIRGFGPATASGILSMMSSNLPYMSDEGLTGLGIEMISKFQEEFKGDPSKKLTPRDLERAFFARQILIS